MPEIRKIQISLESLLLKISDLLFSLGKFTVSG
jgi:hypothetical protein